MKEKDEEGREREREKTETSCQRRFPSSCERREGEVTPGYDALLMLREEFFSVSVWRGLEVVGLTQFVVDCRKVWENFRSREGSTTQKMKWNKRGIWRARGEMAVGGERKHSQLLLFSWERGRCAVWFAISHVLLSPSFQYLFANCASEIDSNFEPVQKWDFWGPVKTSCESPRSNPIYSLSLVWGTKKSCEGGKGCTFWLFLSRGVVDSAWLWNELFLDTINYQGGRNHFENVRQYYISEFRWLFNEH